MYVCGSRRVHQEVECQDAARPATGLPRHVSGLAVDTTDVGAVRGMAIDFGAELLQVQSVDAQLGQRGGDLPCRD